MTYASKDSAPFLIVHGETDQVNPLSEAQAMSDKLKAANVPVTWLVVEGVGHTVQLKPEHVSKMLDFFNRTLK